MTDGSCAPSGTGLPSTTADMITIVTGSIDTSFHRVRCRRLLNYALDRCGSFRHVIAVTKGLKEKAVLEFKKIPSNLFLFLFWHLNINLNLIRIKNVRKKICFRSI